jgi:CheY-like chemotaxis protein
MDKLLSGRRVLVVEDEMLVLMMAEDMLADLGCESVTTAASVDQALSLIDTQVFDAAMLDVNLDGTKSHSVADALAARGVPFVFATGYSGHDMREPYRDRPVLRKPYRYEDLARVFTRLLPADRVANTLATHRLQGPDPTNR